MLTKRNMLKLVVASSLMSSFAAPASAATCHYYGVTISGTVNSNYGNQQVSVNQYAMWRDAGFRGNPVEFRLTTFQDLNASAQVGQIELATNSAFAQNAGIASARFDLAKVSLVQNYVQFSLDSGMSFQLPPPNVVVAPGAGTSPGGLGGIGFAPGLEDFAREINGSIVLSVIYPTPRTGGGYFYSPSGDWSDVAGEFDVLSSGIDNSNIQARYVANFSGRYVGSVACN